jgi:hypothetical protein
MNLDLGDTRLLINTALAERLPLQQAAYVLATAYWETARTMKPVRETLANSDAQAIARLDRAFANGGLPWVTRAYWRPDASGRSWFGRGYVQLTHHDNYVKAGQALGINMVADPGVALNADVAAKIIVRGMKEGWFTGQKLGDHINATGARYVKARNIVNGSDKASEIAQLAAQYEALLRADRYGEKAVVAQPAAAANFWARLWALLSGKG